MVFDRLRKGVKKKKAKAKSKKNKRIRQREKRKQSFREKLDAVEEFKGDVRDLAGATRPAGAARAAARGAKRAGEVAESGLSLVEGAIPEAPEDGGGMAPPEDTLGMGDPGLSEGPSFPVDEEEGQLPKMDLSEDNT